MSVRRWSDDLPDPFTPDSALSRVDAVLRSDFDTGQRARRLYRAPGRRVTLSAVLTGREKAAFDAWFEDGAWSLSGASDSFSGWTATGLGVDEGGALGPDDVACPLVTLSATTGVHQLRRTLDTYGWGTGDLCATVLSVRGSGPARLRVATMGRDGAARGIQLDLVTGAVLSADTGVTVTADEHRGRLRLRVLAPVSTGAEPVQAHIALLDSDGNATFEGDGVGTVELSQVNVRPDDGRPVFLPTAADGTALGAGEGAAWWYCPILSGHLYLRREVQVAGPLDERPRSGLNWIVGLPVLVRDA